MAKNYVQEGRRLYLAIGEGTKSGDPVVVGQIAGIALEDADSANSGAVETQGVFNLTVKAVNTSGNSAVAVGDEIYLVAADTPKLNKKTSGVLYGYALAPIAAGQTATIPVKLKG
ncbi:DUF2190 family protein [Heliobacterium chlorum]|uniref:DUF2190 family protein n=1 Tax=Heliobacterium chlorum TaxID=2698 RepID=A0ABR7SYD4_HELCL|nr:DUF2190 family protein [Heliobacterium chlorum]MBC9783542.1 DUF2190 family protein [Heliobacterium chlorum]